MNARRPVVVALGLLAVLVAVAAVAAYVARRAADSGYEPVDLKDLSAFPFDEMRGRLEDVPMRARRLDGRRVVLDGEMWAPNEAGQVTRFELIHEVDRASSRWSVPKVHERIYARVPQWLPVKNYTRTGYVRVYGTLHVDVEREPTDRSIISVFRMDVNHVDALPVTPPGPAPQTTRNILAQAAAAGAVLLWWFVWLRPRWRRERRAERGLCLNCGYDLRASPGRCPECGATGTSSEQPARGGV